MKPRALELGDDLLIDARETMDVLDADPTEIDTGLLDASGKPIVRLLRLPIGFMR